MAASTAGRKVSVTFVRLADSSIESEGTPLSSSLGHYLSENNLTAPSQFRDCSSTNPTEPVKISVCLLECTEEDVFVDVSSSPNGWISDDRANEHITSRSIAYCSTGQSISGRAIKSTEADMAKLSKQQTRPTDVQVPKEASSASTRPNTQHTLKRKAPRPDDQYRDNDVDWDEGLRVEQDKPPAKKNEPSKSRKSVPRTNASATKRQKAAPKEARPAKRLKDNRPPDPVRKSPTKTVAATRPRRAILPKSNVYVEDSESDETDEAKGEDADPTIVVELRDSQSSKIQVKDSQRKVPEDLSDTVAIPSEGVSEIQAGSHKSPQTKANGDHSGTLYRPLTTLKDLDSGYVANNIHETSAQKEVGENGKEHKQPVPGDQDTAEDSYPNHEALRKDIDGVSQGSFGTKLSRLIDPSLLPLTTPFGKEKIFIQAVNSAKSSTKVAEVELQQTPLKTTVRHSESNSLSRTQPMSAKSPSPATQAFNTFVQSPKADTVQAKLPDVRVPAASTTEGELARAEMVAQCGMDTSKMPLTSLGQSPWKTQAEKDCAPELENPVQESHSNKAPVKYANATASPSLLAAVDKAGPDVPSTQDLGKHQDTTDIANTDTEPADTNGLLDLTRFGSPPSTQQTNQRSVPPEVFTSVVSDTNSVIALNPSARQNTKRHFEPHGSEKPERTPRRSLPGERDANTAINSKPAPERHQVVSWGPNGPKSPGWLAHPEDSTTAGVVESARPKSKQDEAPKSTLIQTEEAVADSAKNRLGERLSDYTGGVASHSITLIVDSIMTPSHESENTPVLGTERNASLDRQVIANGSSNMQTQEALRADSTKVTSGRTQATVDLVSTSSSSVGVLSDHEDYSESEQSEYINPAPRELSSSSGGSLPSTPSKRSLQDTSRLSSFLPPKPIRPHRHQQNKLQTTDKKTSKERASIGLSNELDRFYPNAPRTLNTNNIFPAMKIPRLSSQSASHQALRRQIDVTKVEPIARSPEVDDAHNDETMSLPYVKLAGVRHNRPLPRHSAPSTSIKYAKPTIPQRRSLGTQTDSMVQLPKSRHDEDDNMGERKSQRQRFDAETTLIADGESARYKHHTGESDRRSSSSSRRSSTSFSSSNSCSTTGSSNSVSSPFVESCVEDAGTREGQTLWNAQTEKSEIDLRDTVIDLADKLFFQLQDKEQAIQSKVESYNSGGHAIVKATAEKWTEMSQDQLRKTEQNLQSLCEDVAKSMGCIRRSQRHIKHGKTLDDQRRAVAVGKDAMLAKIEECMKQQADVKRTGM